MTAKQVIYVRLLLRTVVFLLAFGILIREASCRRPTRPELSNITQSPSNAHSYTIDAFDTQCTFVLYGEAQETDQAATRLVKALAELHNTLNRFDETSELARFNNAPENQPFQCSELLWRAFQEAQKAYNSTEGVFDVTIGPLMKFWRKAAENSSQVIDNEQLIAVKNSVGFDRLRLDGENRTVTKTVPNMSVDFGGLAKGLALDLARQLLEQYPFERSFLDFGGNLFLANPADLPKAGEVLIRDPRPGDHTAGAMLGKLLDANRRCISTSANSERPIATGKRPIGHIMDPRTGQPAARLQQVTCVTANGVDSDVFSTAVFIAGPELARQLAEQFPQTGFVLLGPQDDSPTVIGQASFAKSSTAP
ncbi:MAG: FAD:protein FMN transferase [Victivallales bacterium]|nr:FAD:protein FMN transferase [Victivallales bacterium]